MKYHMGFGKDKAEGYAIWLAEFVMMLAHYPEARFPADGSSSPSNCANRRQIHPFSHLDIPYKMASFHQVCHIQNL